MDLARLEKLSRFRGFRFRLSYLETAVKQTTPAINHVRSVGMRMA